MPTIRYQVDMVSQQWSAVCWLACATMLIQFKRHVTPSAAALGLSEGEDFRGPVTIPNFDGQVWARLNTLGFINSKVTELPVWQGNLDQHLIFDQLKRHGPFILHHYCGSFWYGPGVQLPTQGAHSVVVTGTDTDRGDTWFNNPWGTTNIPTTTASIINAIRRWELNQNSKSISWN
jgi:hypothetical protein